MYKIDNKYSFSSGERIQADDDTWYTVEYPIGRGGQGEVYKVRGTDGSFALKWYYGDQYLEKINKEAFYKNLSNNVKNGIPTLSDGNAGTQFIWPLKTVRKKGDSFGYLMKLIPQNYESFKNIVFLRKTDDKTGLPTELHWKSWFARVTSGLNLIRAFEILHKAGYSYQDVNDGGIYVDMDTGDVMICDCDNVAPDGTNLGILGIAPFMAPEVVLGNKLPDRSTDEYSLAVILFRLFLHDHPMHGMESKSIYSNPDLSNLAKRKRVYGSDPHYCLKKTGNVNPPMAKSDVARLSAIYPKVLMDAFEQVFTEGINNTSKRLTATEWRKVLLAVRDHLILVNGKEEFYGLYVDKSLPASCRILQYSDGREVLCMPDKILYRYHFEEYGTDFKHPVAKIINTVKSGYIGLYNKTGKTIYFKLNDRNGSCENNGKMPLLKGMVLKAGDVIIKIL